MKKILQIAAVAAAAFALGSIWSPAGPGVPAEQKIATVDLQKVFEKYYKTVRSTLALKQEAADMQKERKDMVDAEQKQEGEWQKLIDKAEDQAVSAEERARSKTAAAEKLREVKSSEQTIQEYDRASTARLREKERQRRDDIVKEIRSVLDADAKAGGYTLVLDVSGESANMAPIILFSAGVNDLTDSLINELNAAASAITADDQSAAPATKAKPEPGGEAYPVRISVTGSKLTWECRNQSKLEGARVMVANVDTGKGKDMELPQKPPLDLGQLSPGDYEAWIYTLKFGEPVMAQIQISNKERFTIK
jgi:Skp family chaperone for outer membrane proteins